jgi:hypothetical protein
LDTLEPDPDLDPTNSDSSEDESQDPAFADIGEEEDPEDKNE